MPNLDLNNVEFIASYGIPTQLPNTNKPEIVFCGRSNCGKSSLINKLCKRKNLAKTSATPGKTTLINFFAAGDVYLVDLPGYGFASRSNNEIKRWTNLIESYLGQERNIALIVMLLDIRHKPTNKDFQMLDYICQIGLPASIALTKADKLSNQKCMAQKKSIVNSLEIDGQLPAVITSAQTSKGINELQKLIRCALS